MTFRIGPDLLEIYEEEPHGPYCDACGCEMEREECDQCGGEGEFDWEVLQEEDPLWYGPGDTEPCTNCDGAGSWWYCPNASRHEKASDL